MILSMKINPPNLAYNDGYTSNMHYVRYNTESRGIMSLTSDPESQAASYGTDRSTDPITVSSDFIYQLSRVIKFTIIVNQKWWSCHFGFHCFSNQKWHSNQCCVVNEKNNVNFPSFFYFVWRIENDQSAGFRKHDNTFEKELLSIYISVLFLHFTYEWHCYITVFQELLQCDILFCVCGHGCARARHFEILCLLCNF